MDSANLNLSLGRLLQPGQHVEKGGFAGTGGSYNSNKFSLIYIKIQPVQGPDLDIAYPVYLI